METPVVFLNPITGKVDVMPVEMIGAYMPAFGHLTLPEAAQVAAIRDQEAADNLLLSIEDPLGLLFNNREGIPDEITAQPVVEAHR